MKRSYQIIVSLVFVGGSLSVVARPRCAVQRKKTSAKAASAQVAAPAMETAPAAPAEQPAPVAIAPAAPMENNRMDLGTRSDFDAHVAKYPNMVAVFTTTWCGPCKTLKPVLEQLIAENKSIMFVFVDGDKFPGLASQYAKVGFPTLKFFRGGKDVGQAVGGQSKEEMQAHLQRHYNVSPTPAMAAPAPMPAPAPVKMAPAPAPAPMKMESAPAPVAAKTAPAAESTSGNKVVLAQAADFDAHITKHTNVVGIFSTTWCGPCKALKPVLEELVAQNKHITFVYVDGDEFPGLVSKYAKIGFPTLKFFRNGKEVGQAIGGQSKAELQSAFSQHFKG